MAGDAMVMIVLLMGCSVAGVLLPFVLVAVRVLMIPVRIVALFFRFVWNGGRR